MPLIHKASKKAFQKNVETEMKAHPGKENRAQNLAISYSVQRQAKKKKKASGGTVESGSRDMNMAYGGSADEGPSEKANQMGVNKIVPNYDREHNEVKHGQSEARYGNKRDKHRQTLEELRSMPKPKLAEGGEISAKTEKRPMPDNRYNDSKNISDNSGDKPLKESGWTDTPTERQAKANDIRGRTQKVKHPKMVKSDILQVRLRDEEDDLQDLTAPSSPADEPATWHDEEDAKKRGEGPEKQTAHSTGKQVMAKGGKVESSDYDHSDPNADTDSFKDDTPSEDEGEEMARHHEEEYQRQTSGNPDMAKPHNDYQTDPYDGIDDSEHPEDYVTEAASAYADGGEVDDGQPEPEEDEEHHDSIAAAIMANRDRMKNEIDSGSQDMNLAVKYAEGGEITKERGDILSEGATDSDDSSQVDLRRNAEEDQNHEDQLSFKALEKENYSESDGLDDLDYNSDSKGDTEEDETSDEHDMVDSIRKKMRPKWKLSET